MLGMLESFLFAPYKFTYLQTVKIGYEYLYVLVEGL